MDSASIAIIGTHFPRRCGIATFTTYLCDALQAAQPRLDVSVVAVSDHVGLYEYPQRVRFELDEQDIASYERIADELNVRRCDAVCLQHEYGIYGGPYGVYVLGLLEALQVPVVTVLHTILGNPHPEQRRILQTIAQRSETVISVSRIGAKLLHDVYDVPANRIRVIPHGAPDIDMLGAKQDGRFSKGERLNLFSYGLMSPNKGYENVIKAIPAIARNVPNVHYVILGSTHPNIVRATGEEYRSQLQALASKLRVSRRVQFIDEFVSQDSLLASIQSADICITPYRFREQVSSGALSCYIALGMPVVSTPYWYAEEALAENRGILVPFDDPAALAAAISTLATDPSGIRQMSRRAYMFGRDMRWSVVAQEYLDVMANSRSNAAARPLKCGAPSISLVQLLHAAYERVGHMTDSVGMFQHAKYSIPNYLEGYSVDDNARALIASVLVNHLHAFGRDASHDLTVRYLALLNYALNRDTMRFHNILAFDRQWMDDMGSEECHGRALWALGTTLRYSTDRDCMALASELLHLAAPAAKSFASLRATAFAILGLCEYALAQPSTSEAQEWVGQLSRKLLDSYNQNSAEDWKWFESSLTYFNAKLCLAVLKAGSLLEQKAMIDTGLSSLEWLMRIQRPDGRHFVPIGCQGFYDRGGSRARFDQQPIDAYATVAACLFAYRVTGEEQWRDHAWTALAWFLGVNDLHVAMFDMSTGGCFDGLQEDRVNLNQGAESTLALLLSILEYLLLGLPDGNHRVS